MATMSEFVQIASSPAEIMAIASRLRRTGNDLAEKAVTMGRNLKTAEDNPRAMPSDQFSDEFLKHYHQDTGAGPANQAVRDSAVQAGKALAGIGESVFSAMANYSATDEESGTDIDKTKV
jgi:hypothetical protein